MKPDSFRFRPPPVEIPVGVRWVLGRAFADTRWSPPRRIDHEHALTWTSTLGLGPRIAYRCPPETLRRELGEDGARKVIRTRHEAAAHGMALQELLEKLALTRVEINLPVVVLKGMALLESGVTPLGSRAVGDLDVLVPRGQATRLARQLTTEGFQPSGEAASSTHLPPLAHPTLGLLEIHHQLQGVTAHGSGTATIDDLLQCGLCEESPRLGGIKMPTPEILATHTVVHALDQHGRSPTAYPTLRMVGDLFDLANSRGEEVGSLLERSARYVWLSLSRRELQAVSELCQHLAAGSDHAYDGDPGALLRHVVAGAKDSRYQRVLKRRALTEALARGDWQKFRRRLWNPSWASARKSLR